MTSIIPSASADDDIKGLTSFAILVPVHRRDPVLRRSHVSGSQVDFVGVLALLSTPVLEEPLQASDRGFEGRALQVHEAAPHVHVPGRGVLSSGGPGRTLTHRPKSTDQVSNRGNLISSSCFKAVGCILSGDWSNWSGNERPKAWAPTT